MNQILDELYLDPASTGSLGGKNRLLKEAVKHNITEEQVERYLQTKDGYTQHKSRLKKFKRRKMITVDIKDQHQMDLADMQKFAEFNDGVKYLLVIIDCFSRYAWAVPLKTKEPKNVITALKKHIKTSGHLYAARPTKARNLLLVLLKKFSKTTA